MGLIKQLKGLGAEKLAYHANLKIYESYLIDPLNNLSYFSPLETELIKRAAEAKTHARAPNSNFQVGACILGIDERFYPGFNIETAAHDEFHAEDTAIANMFVHYIENILAIAVAMNAPTAESDPTPCGICRQKINEFSIGNTPIIGVKLNWENSIWQVDFTSIKYLLPKAFGRRNL